MAVNSFREDEQIKSAGKWKVIVRLLAFLKDYKGPVFIVLLCMAVTIGISLWNPLLIEYVIDEFVEKENLGGLIGVGIFCLVINLIYVLMVKIRMYLMSKISNQILLNVRQELYQHIQTLSFSFFDSRPSGKILSRIIGDVNSLKDVLSNAVTTLIPDFLTIAGVLVIMFFKNWKLALAALSSLPLLIFWMFLIQKFSHEHWRTYRKKSSNLNAFVHEDIAGIRMVQSLCAQEETKETFQELTREHRKAYIRACSVNDMFFSCVDLCSAIGSVMLYLVGIRFLGFPEVTLGTLASFGLYMGMFWDPISNLSSFYNQLISNISAAERIFELLDTKPEVQDGEGAVELPSIRGEVEFRQVSFAYDEGTKEETKVLKDVNFRVKPGETIALVGPTGAGKTTIASLISRFYDVQEGQVCIDGWDVRTVTQESLRSQMGVMTQESFIFRGTVRENILYGKPDATEEEVIAAAKAVHAHDFIVKMENGYDTMLKERGAGLSIGQKQLIAFARTLISDPKILILDEATSSIDTHTEKLVQEGIRALLTGRTSFVIAHRLSTVRNADRIFVVDEGGILESGTPEELLLKKGAYYRLYMAQSI